MGDGESKESLRDTSARRWAWRAESIASGLVALLALFISAYTVYINRLQLKAQSWPRLTVVGEPHDETTKDTASGLKLSLKNRGVAPAEVRAMRITVGDQTVSNWPDWLKLLMAKQKVAAAGRLLAADSPVGEVIGAGESLPLLDTDSADLTLVIAADDESTFSVCYCSTLDDCWQLDTPLGGDAPRTTPVARCPAYDRFEGVPKSLIKAEVEKRRAQKAVADAGQD